jgi:alanyl-tRNA synthetase
LNWALREVLGSHIQQAGSVVAPDRLRFDFSHPKAVSAEELEKVERLVNERVLADEVVAATTMPLAQAKQIAGVRAMFGEKYPDPVRVISVGTTDPLHQATLSNPVEFCGGTHLARTSQVGFFKIVAEEAVAKGVRRITAVTGRGAIAEVQDLARAMSATTGLLAAAPHQHAQRIATMQKEIKTLRKKLESGAGAARGGDLDALVASAQLIGDVKLITGELAAASLNQLRAAVDQIRQKAGEKVAIMVGWIEENNVTLIASVSDAVIAAKGLKAGDWVKQIAPLVGGGGGGKPTMAQAGGKEPAKLPEALKAAAQWARQKLE